MNLLAPGPIGFGLTMDAATRSPTGAIYRSGDGSWCTVTERGDVAEGGPRSLWEDVERAFELWRDVGEPGWGRFGLTATSERQTVWLDHPDGRAWTLPTED